MNDFITLVSIIIILILIIFPIYRYYHKQKEEFDINRVKRAVDDVGKFGSQIGNMMNSIGEEIGKVNNLGREISRLGPEISRISRFPIELGEELGNKVTKVANDAGGIIEDEFNRVIGEVEDMANEVSDFTTETVGQVEGELNRIMAIIEDIPNQVVSLANEIFVDFIPKMFEKGWQEFKKHVIDPMVDFFNDVGEVFEKVGDVFMEIIETLINFPKCIPYYAIDTGIKITEATLKTILPSWLKNIIRWFHNNINKTIIIPIFWFFMNIFKTVLQFLGFKFDFDEMGENRKKCYNFGPLDEVFDAFKEFFEIVFKGIKELFKFIPFDRIIQEILQLIGLGNGGATNGNKPSPAEQYIQQTQQQIQETVNEATEALRDAGVPVTTTQVNKYIDTAKSQLKSVGINIPDTPDLQTLRQNIPGITNLPSIPKFGF
jgi:hypothetical protein